MGKKFSYTYLMPGIYSPGDSLLHTTPTHWKIFLGLGLLILAGFGQWWGIGAVSLVCLFGLFMARIGFVEVCRRLKTFAWFILFLGIFPVFFTPGSPIEVADGHSLGLTLEGLEAGMLFSCRMILMFLVSMIFMHTTKPSDLLKYQLREGEGDNGLRTFFREAGTVGLMAFQLLPILFGEVEKRLVVELNENKISGNLFNKARQVAHLLIPLTVFVFENTERYSEQLHKEKT